MSYVTVSQLKEQITRPSAEPPPGGSYLAGLQVETGLPMAQAIADALEGGTA